MYNLADDFKTYVDSYCHKLEVIYNFLKSFENFKLQQFGKEMKALNKSIGYSRSEVDFENQVDEFFKDTEIVKMGNISETWGVERNLFMVKKIIKWVGKYIIKEAEYLEKYDTEYSFKQHISEFMEYINEEASILFCYRVKDSFEFMDAPEKQAIAQLNRYLLPYLKQKKTPEDLEKMEKTSESVINSSSSAIELFRKLIYFLKQATGIRCIQLLVVDPGSKEIEVKLYAYVDHLPMYDVAHHSGIIAEAVKGKKVIFVNSVYEDPTYDIFDATIKSELVVPIFVGKNVYGVLNFEDDHLNRFSKEFIAAVQRICTLISGKLISFPDIYSLEKGKIA